MIRLTAALISTGAIFASTAAFADRPPPAGALSLSAVIQKVEAANDVSYVDDVSWDDDGYWEVEFVNAAGAKVEIRVDPLTGEPLTRR